MRALSRFLKREKGQSMVEYSLIIAVVVLAAVGALSLFADKDSGMYELILTTIGDVL